MKFVAASIALIAVAALASPVHGQGMGQIKVGQPFPDIVFPSTDGEPMSIADFRGRKVLLHVFASW